MKYKITKVETKEYSLEINASSFAEAERISRERESWKLEDEDYKIKIEEL